MKAKAIFATGIFVAFGSLNGMAEAQLTPMAPQKALTQTSCKDYIEMNDTVKPKFIYYTVGYSRQGKPKSAVFDVVDVDKMQPALDAYCRVNLTASAYDKVMTESMASEKTNK